MSIQVTGISGIPLIQKGDSLPDLICANTRPLAEITPTPDAERIASKTGEDPRFVQGVLDSSVDIIIEYPFILSELPFGHVGVRAGVDNSNIEGENIILLPKDPMAEAREIREKIYHATGVDVGVIITDTCGRAFRRGQTGSAIGWAGMTAIMGESNNGVPVVKFSGCGTWKGHDSLYFTKEEDLIRKALHI